MKAAAGTNLRDTELCDVSRKLKVRVVIRLV